MPKNTVTVDRKQEIRDLLSGRDLLPERFVELALMQNDVQRIDIMKFSPGTWNPSKVDDIKAGFDPNETSAWVLQHHGPGRYRLSIVHDGEYILHKTWSMGEPEENGQDRGQHPRQSDANPGYPDFASKIQKDLNDTLRSHVAVRQAQDFLAESESRASEREIRPAQLMMQSMNSMMDMMQKAMLQPPKQDNTIAVIIPLFTQMMSMQQQIFMAMIEQQNKQKPDGSGLKGIAEGLAALEKTMTGRIGELFAEKDTGGLDWAKIAEIAAPLLERAIGVMERSQQSAPRMVMPQSRVLRQAPSRVTEDPNSHQPVESTERPAEEQVKLHPDPEVDKVLHEAADLAFEMLKSRDFTSLRSILDLNFPEFLDRLDPEANPIIYVQWLKRLNPEFDKLRAEFTDFLKWLAENVEPDPAPDPQPEFPPKGNGNERG